MMQPIYAPGLIMLLISTVLAAATNIDVIAIKEGADLDLSCPIVVQKADMIISWTCDDEPASIRSSRIHVTEAGKLRIRSAKVGDSCNYRCEAADGFGTWSVVIKVIIVDKRLMERLPKQTHNKTLEGQRELTRPAQVQVADILHNADHELQVEVSPSKLRLERHRIFSLECRVKHAAHLMAPQIIWLKELIGRRPTSLSQAHEQNLVLIDGDYYHSLNWPRSITYSQKSLSSHSALLIRQASFVHSGKYICFAGYPPAIMSANLSSSGDHMRSLKYKMAMAEVKVDDEEGDRLGQVQSGLLSADDNPLARWRSLVKSALTANTWTRNLIFLLLLLSCLLFVSKKILIRYKSTSTAADAATSRVTQSGQQAKRSTDFDELTLADHSSNRYSAHLVTLSNQTNHQHLDQHLYSEIGQPELEEPIYKVPRALGSQASS